MKVSGKIYFGFGIFLALLSLTGCSQLLDAILSSSDGNSSSYSEPTVSATKSVNWNYSESNPILEIGSDVRSVNISGNISGKSLYVVNANKTSDIIKNNVQRYPTQYNSRVADENEAETFNPESLFDESGFFLPKNHYHPKEDVLQTLKEHLHSASARSVAPLSSVQTVSQITPVVGSSKKNLWLDCSSKDDSFTSKSVTLRAIGNSCYVWVADENYTTGFAYGNKIDSTIAQTYAAKFDNIYPCITNVFGDESDYLIDYGNSANSFKYLSMDGYCDTGKKINIVIFDIDGDGDLPEEKQAGVLGYFASKDYVSNIPSAEETSMRKKGSAMGFSNKGKYFYIDSQQSVACINPVISTLAHEFQHMVHFNQKYLLRDEQSSTAYNEMLSMVCEDLIQERLGFSDSDTEKSNRIKAFNYMYFTSGITEYRNDGYSAYSYPTSYVLGAWLCRQYGGAALVKAMMNNDYVDSDSIVAAVNSLNGTNYTFEDLFRQFLLMMTGSKTYTMNQDAAQTVTYGSGSSAYKYPMKAINLWSSLYEAPDDLRKSLTNYKYSDYNWRGPFLFSGRYNYELRPEYGVCIHKICDYSSWVTSKTVTFSSDGSKNLTLYLIVQ